MESQMTRRAFRHTHQVTIRQGDWKDGFRFTPPAGMDPKEYAAAEVVRRYPGAAKWGQYTIEVHG